MSYLGVIKTTGSSPKSPTHVYFVRCFNGPKDDSHLRDFDARFDSLHDAVAATRLLPSSARCVRTHVEDGR